MKTPDDKTPAQVEAILEEAVNGGRRNNTMKTHDQNLPKACHGPAQSLGPDPITGLEVYHFPRKTVIAKSVEFEKKGLATHGVNVGFKCGNACLYCSVASNIRCHVCFSEVGRTAFEKGFVVVDTGAVDRLRRDHIRLRPGSVVMLCTLSDGWSPQARKYGLGSGCLRYLLENTPAEIRILTKNAEVRDEFPLIARHRDRVMFGLSITGLPEHEDELRVVEPFASPIRERIAAMDEAHRLGLRTYAMFCPLFPGLFADQAQVERLIRMAVAWGAEAIWSEIPNPRGPGLRDCVEAWRAAGHTRLADAVDRIRHVEGRSEHGVKLTRWLQAAARKLGLMPRLRILAYRSSFTAGARSLINQDPGAVVWLGK